jgi:hypothetical protein
MNFTPNSDEAPLECGGDPHVALLDEPLAVRQPAASREGGGGSLALCATSANFGGRRNACSAAQRRGAFTPKSSGDPYIHGP